MDETFGKQDIYGALPQGLAPRGLTCAAAAAFVGLDVRGFEKAISDGLYRAPTLPGAVFDVACLTEDMDQLSAIERVSVPRVISVGASTTGPKDSGIGTSTPQLDAMEAWRAYFANLLTHLVASAEQEGAIGDGGEISDAPDPGALAAYGRNLQWLVSHWMATKDFETDRAPSTVSEYRRNLEKIAAHLGAMPLVCLNDNAIAADLDDWADLVEEESGPRAADARLSALSVALSWASRAREVPEITNNWVLGYRRRHAADRSEIIYSDDEIQRLIAAGGNQIATGVIIASETALRISDILRLEWDDYDGDAIKVVYGKQRAGKQKKRLTIPCTTRLKTHLDGMERRGTTVLTTPTGKRWDRHNFSDGFRKICIELGIVGKHFHDLRGTAITRFAELGLTAEQIASVTGQSLKTITTILERYMARTAKMARTVIQRVDESRNVASDQKTA